MQCSIDKNSIRAVMKQKRRAQSSDAVQNKSNAVCSAFINLDAFKKAKTVCVYMSAFGEVDTSLIIKSCIELGKKIAVPVVDGDDIYLSCLQGDLEKGAYGICEPSKKVLVNPLTVDIFAVPGIAFDEHGSRVGFGKGYYDKLLSSACATKVGLLYDFQLVEKLPCYEHDIRMDYLITESKVLDMAGSTEVLK